MSTIKQAVIFAGGRGERLRPLTDHLPKPMVTVLGKPFLDYLMKTLEDAGITKILFLLGYRSECIIEHYGDRLSNGIEIEYSVGAVENLTGRRLLDGYPFLDERFLLLYGDNYWPIEIQEMLKVYESKKAPAMTTVFSNKNGTGEYGFENNIEVKTDSYVSKYDKTRASKKLNGVDIGFFILEKSILDPKMLDNFSFEEKILSSLALKQKLLAYVTDRQYYYVTNVESLRNFEQVVKREGFAPLNPQAERMVKK